MKYAIITPVRNEEKNLPKLAESIINQTILPQIWIIVDDNSSDSSPKTIEELTKKYSWIHKTRKPQHEPYGHISFAKTVKTGFDCTLEVCKRKNIELTHIAKIDADISLPANYFEVLMEKFKDQNLGIASGVYSVQTDKKKTKNKVFFIQGHIPDERLYNINCLEDVGGFPITYAPDTVMLIKAKLKGWKTESFPEIQIYASRDRIMSSGGWQGSKTSGYLRYYLDYHPLMVILLAVSKLIEWRPDLSIAVFIGYFEGFLGKKSKIDDDEIKNYFRKKRLREVINSIL